MSEEAYKEIRMMLVDDHASFRQPLAFMLEQEPDLAVISQARSLAEAREMLESIDIVDIAIVDLDLPDGNGAELIGKLRAANPQGMVLILTASADRSVHARAVEAGAARVLHKSVPVKDIIDTVRRLDAGEALLSPDEVSELVRAAGQRRTQGREAQRAIESLTPREREVLQALAQGLSDKEIANQLYLGLGTVRSYTASILKKLGVHSRLQALVFAVRHGAVKIN